MNITTQTAQQLLDTLNDYIANGDLGIDAITFEEVHNMTRKEMNEFLLVLMRFAADYLEA